MTHRKRLESEIRAAIRNLMKKQWIEQDPTEQCFDHDEDRMSGLMIFMESRADRRIADDVREHLIRCSRCRYLFARLLAGRGSGRARMADMSESTVHTLRIINWRPHTLNQLIGCHWGTRSKRKKFDADVIRGEAIAQGIPKATGKRRVSLTIVLGPRWRKCDPDSLWKSTLDSCVHAGLLVDDSAKWCQLGSVRFERGEAPATIITLEDLADGHDANTGRG